MQAFGGNWTLIKLEVLEKYLSFYTTALKKKFKLCYIDAFAGSGNVDVKGFGPVLGSALRALDYPFERYIFIEKNEDYVKLLQEKIFLKGVHQNVEIKTGDCNQILESVNSFDWYRNRWRGVIFLDPYAMNLLWKSLISIAQTQIFDVWYLFPLSALNRVLPKDGNISPQTKERITGLLGTDEWEKEIYYESSQLSLFGDCHRERILIDGIKAYVIKRLKSIFPEVSEKSKVLRNPQNNSPLFLLCFAVSNPTPKAIETSLRAANHILTHTN